MKILKFFLALIVLLSACEKDHCDDPGQNTNTPSAQKMIVTRPFELTFTTVVDTDASIPPTPCTGDLPGLANAGLFVHGNASQLGKLDAAQSRLQDISCNLSFATAILSTSIAGQLTGANGDKIYYTGNDEINVANLLTGAGPSGTITGIWTITGGTGRFEGSTGSFTINGSVDFASATFSGVGIGTITY